MKKYIHLLLFMCVCMALTFCNSDSVKAELLQHKADKATQSSNINEHNYKKWTSPSTSYLYNEVNGDFTRAEYVSDLQSIVVERFDKNFKLISKNTIPMDTKYDRFGGIYINDNNLFLVSGRLLKDSEVSDSSIAVTKYDKAGTRIKSLFLSDINTTLPFYAGSCAFLEKDGSLYVRTCHRMGMSSDGLNHQASLMFKINMEACTLESIQKDVAYAEVGYVSHSFNQFLAQKNGLVYACDHGDAFSRGVEVLRFNTGSVNSDVSTSVPFAFDGEQGDNETGAALGGFAISSTHTLSVGTSKKQMPGKDASELERGIVKNIFVATTDLNNMSTSDVKWITKYDISGDYTAGNPYIIDLKDDTYMLIWQVYKIGANHRVARPTDKLNYVKIDHQGNKIGKIQAVTGALSNCQPILAGSNIVWYVTDNSCPTFYCLPKDANGDSAETDDTQTASDSNKQRVVLDDNYDGIFECYTSADGKKFATLKEIIPMSSPTCEYLIIPSHFVMHDSEYMVTKIAKDSIKDLSGLTMIRFPESITTFEKNCITNCPDVLTIYNDSKTPYIPGKNYILYDKDGTRKGKLKYWFRVVDSNGTKTAKEVSEIKDGIACYALIDKNEKSLQFMSETNTGKIKILSTVVYYDGDIITPPASPTRSGYKFAGWYSSGKRIDFSKPIKHDYGCVTAKWEKSSGKKDSSEDSSSSKLSTQKISTTANTKYKASTLKKKKVTFAINASAKGKLSYKVTKGSSKYISVSKNGKVTLKKGCKKGTYKITVSAAKTKKYKAATKVVVIKVE